MIGNALSADYMTPKELMRFSQDNGYDYPLELFIYPVSNSLKKYKKKRSITDIYAPNSDIILTDASYRLHNVVARSVHISSEDCKGSVAVIGGDIQTITCNGVQELYIKNVKSLKTIQLEKTENIKLKGLPDLRSIEASDLTSLKEAYIQNLSDLELSSSVKLFFAGKRGGVTDGDHVVVHACAGDKKNLYSQSRLNEKDAARESVLNLCALITMKDHLVKVNDPETGYLYKMSPKKEKDFHIKCDELEAEFKKQRFIKVSEWEMGEALADLCGIVHPKTRLRI